VQSVCARRSLDLVFVPHLLMLGPTERNCRSGYKGPVHLVSSQGVPDIRPSSYIRLKRGIDFIAALVLIIAVLPLLLITIVVVLLDVGWPVMFWQQRIGRGGRTLQVYKFRTLKPPFDRKGQKIAEEQRISVVGRLLRRTRFDELPQLLNVLIGDMSLIGPRPLLPRDQPPDSTSRLSVRPGITGWAQVNGGTSLSSTEKDALDVWYIRNASLLLDLRIIAMTALRITRGDRRSEEALMQAYSSQVMHSQDSKTASNSPLSFRLATETGASANDARHLHQRGPSASTNAGPQKLSVARQRSRLGIGTSHRSSN
jgi:lipopolysaccharide/colanic/teichoic acid biosynthesis glycosyltransferase